MTMVEGISAAEAIAASICWLARFRYEGAGTIYEGIGHKPSCRFCAKPSDELLTTYGLSQVRADQFSAWRALPRSVRQSKIGEAQEPPWYERLEEAEEVDNGTNVG